MFFPKAMTEIELIVPAKDLLAGEPCACVHLQKPIRSECGDCAAAGHRAAQHVVMHQDWHAVGR